MKDASVGQLLGVIAILGIGVFCYTQYRKMKAKEKDLQPKLKK